MSPSVALRPVTPSDESLMFDVYAGSRAVELEPVPWSDEEKSAFLRFQFEAQNRHYATRFTEADYSVVVSDGEPVGRLWVDQRDDEIRILDIALLPDKREQGIGTRLLTDLLADARATNKPVRIYVETYQRSFGLFDRLGFRVTKDDRVSRLMEWRPEEPAGHIDLRDAGEADDGFLFDLYRQLREPEVDGLGWDDAQIAAFIEMQFKAQALGYRVQFPNADHRIILRDREPIGCIVVDRSHDHITLVDITLLPEVRGRGIGTGMLKDLLVEAAAKRMPVSLKVTEGNPARRLYERLGFKSHGGDGLYEQMEWRPDL